MFCDQDDVWLPNKIEYSMSAMYKLEQKYGDVPLMVFTDLRIVDASLNLMEESFYGCDTRSPYNHDWKKIMFQNNASGNTMIFNKKLAETIKGIPSEKIPMWFGHDGLVNIVACILGKVQYLQEQTILYRQHSENVFGGGQGRKGIADRIQNYVNNKHSFLTRPQKIAEVLIELQDLSTSERLFLSVYSRIDSCHKLHRMLFYFKNKLCKLYELFWV